MLVYDDADHDGHLNLNEFYAAFSKLYSRQTFFAYSVAFCLAFLCIIHDLSSDCDVTTASVELFISWYVVQELCYSIIKDCIFYDWNSVQLLDLWCRIQLLRWYALELICSLMLANSYFIWLNCHFLNQLNFIEFFIF